jgi:hypothetical protein
VHFAPTSQETFDHRTVYQFPFQKWVFAKRFGIDSGTPFENGAIDLYTINEGGLIVKRTRTGSAPISEGQSSFG